MAELPDGFGHSQGQGIGNDGVADGETQAILSALLDKVPGAYG